MTENIQKLIDEISLLINNNDLELAKTKINKIISSNPSNDIFYNILGVINLKLKIYPDAIENFKKAIKNNDKFISAIINLGIAYQEINKIKKQDIPFVAASDAFFPFTDNIKLLIKKRCKAIVQPNGSINDKKIIEFANKNKFPLYFSKYRFFKH